MSRKRPQEPIFDRDNPEWTKRDFERATRFPAGASLQEAATEIRRGRGRPKSETPKEAIKLRVDADVLERYRASGPGWQTRMQEAIRRAAPRGRRKVG